MYFAQGRNAVMPMRLEPAAPRSRVKHSTTEPLRSLYFSCYKIYRYNTNNHFAIHQGPTTLNFKLLITRLVRFSVVCSHYFLLEFESK